MTRHRHHPLPGCAALAAAAFLAACGSQAAPVAPASVPAPSLAASRPALPAATATPADTPTPAPTATPKPIPHSPLTGQQLPSADLATRRPIMVKLGNSEVERPQSGLAAADVVYESLTEGGITRYAAIFQSHDAANIGPVRSARLSDLQIAPEYGAVLAHVGASSPIMAMLKTGSVLDLDQFFWMQYYHRTTDREAPYNVYTSTQQLRAGGADRGFTATDQLQPWTFEQAPATGGQADSVDFNFAPELHVQYVWNAGQHAYNELEYGSPTADATTGQPVPIANLVLQFTPVITTNIVEDANGIHSLEFQMTGQGKAVVFHDGKEEDGTWQRSSLSSRTTFHDASGQHIAFTPGATWIALLADGTPISVKPAPAPSTAGPTA